jgi:hypothetical protein
MTKQGPPRWHYHASDDIPALRMRRAAAVPRTRREAKHAGDGKGAARARLAA